MEWSVRYDGVLDGAQLRSSSDWPVFWRAVCCYKVSKVDEPVRATEGKKERLKREAKKRAKSNPYLVLVALPVVRALIENAVYKCCARQGRKRVRYLIKLDAVELYHCKSEEYNVLRGNWICGADSHAQLECST